MSVVALVNVATTDAYSDPATLMCPDADVLTVHVRNAAVLMQLAETAGGGAPDWQPPQGVFVPPGDRSMRKLPGRGLNGVRFKSAAAAVPARVSADAS